MESALYRPDFVLIVKGELVVWAAGWTGTRR